MEVSMLPGCETLHPTMKRMHNTKGRGKRPSRRFEDGKELGRERELFIVFGLRFWKFLDAPVKRGTF
jgi:hypothetical protein